MYTTFPVIGHDWAVAQLQRAFTNGRARHAFLLQGPASIGKTTLARSIAMALNCTNEPKPCGECRACRLIASNGHPDIAIVEAERVGGTLKIDQIRELQRKLSLRPYEGRYRVAILRRFQEAQAAAQNAILKTLEEPAGNVVLILTAEEPSAILPTIHSRCQIFNLRPLSIASTIDALERSWGLAHDKASVLAHLSGGRIGWAVRSLEDEKELEFRQNAIDLLEQSLTSTRVQRFQLIEGLKLDKSRTLDLLDFWQTYWRDVMLLAAGSSAALTNVDREASMITVAQHVGQDEAQHALQATRTALIQLSGNANSRLCLEVLMLNYPWMS